LPICCKRQPIWPRLSESSTPNQSLARTVDADFIDGTPSSSIAIGKVPIPSPCTVHHQDVSTHQMRNEVDGWLASIKRPNTNRFWCFHSYLRGDSRNMGARPRDALFSADRIGSTLQQKVRIVNHKSVAGAKVLLLKTSPLIHLTLHRTNRHPLILNSSLLTTD
jgi:hypothetical protein